MKSTRVILLIWCLLILTFMSMTTSNETIGFEYPKSWPKPEYDFKKSPLNKEAVELGRSLFYDPILSKDSTISCGSCHLSYTAFTHVDHALSHGIGDSIGLRSSPVLINLAWNKFFMWDGSINHIEVQALGPITNSLEMGEDIVNVVSKLQRSQRYTNWFEKVYGSKEITGQNLLKAIAQFQLTLVSSNSKYDKVITEEEVFTEQEERGYALFKKNCNTCHQEPLFTTGEFENNGLSMDSTLNDYGRMGITKNPVDSLKFKVPTLRNIEFSFPYMHDGRFNKLSQVLDHYTEGINHSSTIASELKKEINLTSNEKVDVIAFLLTLSDKEFLFNPDFAFPRNNLTTK